jgi:hypothetical protein
MSISRLCRQEAITETGTSTYYFFSFGISYVTTKTGRGNETSFENEKKMDILILFFGENRTTEIMRTRPVAQQDEDIFHSK